MPAHGQKTARCGNGFSPLPTLDDRRSTAVVAEMKWDEVVSNFFAGKKVLVVVGARPQFIKAAVLLGYLEGECELHMLHTGQHYSHDLSGIFFEQLGIREPDENLKIGSCSYVEFVSRVMIGVDRALDRWKPELVIVFGDVNSSLAAALATIDKNWVSLVHVEAGERYGDPLMMEEKNRLLIDRMAGLLICHSENALGALAGEGIVGDAWHKIVLAPDLMYEHVHTNLARAENESRALETYGLEAKKYLVATIHRKRNVESEENLSNIVQIFRRLAEAGEKVIFPLHPGTERQLKAFNLYSLLAHPDISIIPPQGPLDFLKLMNNARGIVSDSGGIQKETLSLGIPIVVLDERACHSTMDSPLLLLAGTDDVEEVVLKTLSHLNDC